MEFKELQEKIDNLAHDIERQNKGKGWPSRFTSKPRWHQRIANYFLKMTEGDKGAAPEAPGR